MTKLAFIFPGQGSQSVGMMSDWGEHQSIVDNTFAEASEVLGYDLQNICQQGPAEKLNQTEITQPAMLAAGVASYRVWSHMALPAAAMHSGHSLGEYSALVCANSIAFADAIQLVSARGRLMQAAVAEGEGAMAAIIGLDDDAVVQACAEVGEGIVSAVNFNSPGQVVIAGNKASVEQAMDNAKAAGAKRALPLPVSVPSHCALMQSAADELYQKLLDVSINMPDPAVIHNQNAAQAGSVEEIRALLKLQLFQPVLWVDCVNSMQQAGAETLIEFGPGKVLSGLARRIDRNLAAHPVFDQDSLTKAQQTLMENE
ncbi:MAG: ACP S-malonyltransferase [Gammaproteobacteria bacterium]|nr:ACP S-malonyltransferase [Gammaproteobacteria bacterium]